MPLRESQHLVTALKQLFEHASSLVVLLLGPEHVVAYANPAYLSMRERREVIGRPLRESAPELAGQGFLGFLDQVLATGEPFVGQSMAVRIRPADGTDEERYFDFIYQPVIGEGGRPIGIFGQGAEVTGRVQAERALRDSETRLELATRASNLGVWDWDIDAGKILIDSGARALVGLADEVITPAILTARLHPDDSEETQALVRRALDPAVKASGPYEYRVLRPDGTVLWVRTHGRALFEMRDGQETAVRYVGTIADITEERRAQDAVRQSERRLRLAIDAGRMAVWEVDASGQIQGGPELNRLLGFPEDARPSLEELQANYYPGEAERLHAIGTAALRRGERFIEAEYRHLWPDKSVHWLLARSEPRLGPDGLAHGGIGVLMDITERHEDEERLKLLAREVDHRANNLLAVVQGAVHLTHARSVAEFKEALLGRIAALGHAHQLLAGSRWLSADLSALVHEELKPYCERNQRCLIQGPKLALPPSLAQGVSIAIHELATNAVKYGALSVPNGRVEVSWTDGAPGQPVIITWREMDGPAVSGPQRKGTGTRVIERALSGARGGSAEIDWRPDGVVCRLCLGDATATEFRAY